MARILAIDDDENACKLLDLALSKQGYEVRTALSGIEGLKALQEFDPDALIIDRMMPGMDGYEVVRRIRRDPKYANVPILILTAEADLEGKITAFDSGADDYLNKPFAPEELTARIAALIRRSHASNGTGKVLGGTKQAHVLAVHALRGGIGSTTLAVNLALALRNLWGAPTLLVDLALLSGHVNLFLDRRVKHNWASLQGYDLDDIDDQLLDSLIHEYNNGLHFIAAPRSPSESELVSLEAVSHTLMLLDPSYDYIVVDLPHDFGDFTLELLDRADVILSLVAPELAALRAAAQSIDTYDKLGYELDNVQLVLNRPFEEPGVDPMDIFRALQHPIGQELPYGGGRCVRAINNGKPLVSEQSKHELSQAIEDLAYNVSKSTHQEFPPISPSSTWRRVQDRRESGKLLGRVGRLFK
ncbi:MAG: response regulator [Candidatus Promineifilaceae bacterium]|nr:response regulator [Candidatus Promineifilaceae bacterium]